MNSMYAKLSVDTLSEKIKQQETWLRIIEIKHKKNKEDLGNHLLKTYIAEE